MDTGVNGDFNRSHHAMITEKNGIKQGNWNHAKCQLDGSQNQRSQIYIIRIIKSWVFFQQQKSVLLAKFIFYFFHNVQQLANIKILINHMNTRGSKIVIFGHMYSYTFI
jgi:hypothetical protein